MHAAGEMTSACIGAERYMAGLKAELGITERQSKAWAAYVAALQSNRERMEAAVPEHGPFGPVADRLAALAAMRQATSRLYARLSTPQRDRAGKVIPLCCQPPVLAAAA